MLSLLLWGSIWKQTNIHPSINTSGNILKGYTMGGRMQLRTTRVWRLYICKAIWPTTHWLPLNRAVARSRLSGAEKSVYARYSRPNSQSFYGRHIHFEAGPPKTVAGSSKANHTRWAGPCVIALTSSPEISIFFYWTISNKRYRVCFIFWQSNTIWQFNNFRWKWHCDLKMVALKIL